MPGASALLAALTMSGLPSDQVYFAGFLPQKTKPREALLASLKTLTATLIFYEAPHRLVETLEHLQQLGDRDAAVGRELTKMYEECPRGSLSQLVAHYTKNPPKGECVVLVSGATAQETMGDDAIDAALLDALARLSVKEAVAEVTAASGRAKSAIYARALELK
jgi:16S rRNA (cytidine1402-2'-O)-methyltransferase